MKNFKAENREQNVSKGEIIIKGDEEEIKSKPSHLPHTTQMKVYIILGEEWVWNLSYFLLDLVGHIDCANPILFKKHNIR